MDIAEYLETLGNYGAWLLANGTEFPAQPLPLTYRRVNSCCYHNALTGVRRSKGRLRYAEGFGYSPDPALNPLGVWIGHAWCLDGEDRVIDCTWAQPEGYRYFGIAFDEPPSKRIVDPPWAGPYGSLPRSTSCMKQWPPSFPTRGLKSPTHYENRN